MYDQIFAFSIQKYLYYILQASSNSLMIFINYHFFLKLQDNINILFVLECLYFLFVYNETVIECVISTVKIKNVLFL